MLTPTVDQGAPAQTGAAKKGKQRVATEELQHRVKMY